MSSIESENIKHDLDELIVSNYSVAPKEFAQEEVAVKQTLQKLLHVLAQPQNQQRMLATIPVESIENMTRRGQLTLVAQSLDDKFLPSVEKALKNSSIEFEYEGKKMALSSLYERCKEDLRQEDPNDHESPLHGREPNFGDVLLRMYTKESPFYKKLNAIVGGYNDPKTTTDEEKVLAFLLNIAIHKAGLDKRKFEVQQTPDELYRGQSFGLEIFEKKFEKVKELQAEGKLTTLSPEELAEINIVDIAGKKIVSTTADLKEASKFAKMGELVLHVKNPEALADFYNVANVSSFPKEAEYISRIPDDIAMVPISITKDTRGVSHIDVVCIHSKNVLLQNSTRIYDIRESLKDYVKNEINQSSGFTAYFSPSALDRKQINLMESLIVIINKSEDIEMFEVEKQDEFLQAAFLTLRDLYKTNPTEYQKEGFDEINAMLQEYAAVVSNEKVVHAAYHSREIIAHEEKKMDANLDGKRIWLASLAGKAEAVIIGPIKDDLNKLLAPASSRTDIRQAASGILDAMQNSDEMKSKFSALKDSMDDIIASLDQIEMHQQILSNNQPKVLPSSKFKLGLQHCKEKDPANEHEYEGGMAAPSAMGNI